MEVNSTAVNSSAAEKGKEVHEGVEVDDPELTQVLLCLVHSVSRPFVVKRPCSRTHTLEATVTTAYVAIRPLCPFRIL